VKRLHDEALDVFRGGVAELRLDGELCAHVVSEVVHFWSPGRPFTMQERVFLRLEWTTGRAFEVIEDYPTWERGEEVWTAVSEMRTGVLTPNSHDTTYAVTWLEGDERERAHAAYGPRDDDPFPG
jgi:hypothetical protein